MDDSKDTQVSDQDQSVSKKRWYVMQVYSGFEKFVMQALQERIRIENLEERFGKILVPTEEVVELRGGQKRKSERKFFPGYVLIEMVMDDQTWHLARTIPKVLGFIGGVSDKPSPLTPAEVESVLQRVQDSSEKPKPRILFEVGEVLRIKEGPFADFNGVVEEVNYEKSRLRVAVLIFGRSTPVELQFDQVEKG